MTIKLSLEKELKSAIKYFGWKDIYFLSHDQVEILNLNEEVVIRGNAKEVHKKLLALPLEVREVGYKIL